MGGCSAVSFIASVWRNGNTISLHLRLSQAVLVPVLQYGCQIWGMPALVLLLLMMLVLHYSACMINTSGPFAVFRRPLLVSFYLQSWASCFCKYFGGAKLYSFGTVWLFFLLVPSTTLSVCRCLSRGCLQYGQLIGSMFAFSGF